MDFTISTRPAELGLEYGLETTSGNDGLQSTPGIDDLSCLDGSMTSDCLPGTPLGNSTEMEEGHDDSVDQNSPQLQAGNATSSFSPSSVLATPIAMLRLPSPCPTPTVFTPDVAVAIEQNKLKGLMKLRFLRQCVLFYWGVCPRPTPFEYRTMAITLCNKFPSLKDKKPKDGKYWVRINSSSISFIIIILCSFFLFITYCIGNS